MIVTPTNTGSMIAGAGVGLFGWSLAEKGNKIPFVKRVYTEVRKEQLFTWMNGNKGMSLLALEALNFGIHGVSDANQVIFALGNTVSTSSACGSICRSGNVGPTEPAPRPFCAE